MSLEVNRMEPTGFAAAAPEAVVASPSRLEGYLRHSRAGWARALQIVTGLALLRWLGFALASLVGYRHQATLSLAPASLDLEGERRLMGLSLGRTRRIIPLTTVRQVRLAHQSSGWALAAAAAVLVFCATAAGVLLLWGIRGRQPSWVLLAALILGVGLLLDAVAYLWMRRRARQARATLDIITGGERLRLSGAPARGAGEILDRLAATSVARPRA